MDLKQPTTQEKVSTALWICIAGAATLFVELALIRYVPGQVRVLGYFTNFVLFSAFLGFGLGMMMSGRWPQWTQLSWLAAPAVMAIVGLANLGSILHVRPAKEEFLFLEYQTRGIVVPLFPFLTLAFLFLTAGFIPLGHFVGRTLVGDRPLWRYGWNLVGSLLGILLFVGMNLTSAPPWSWMLLAGLLAAVTLLEAPPIWKMMGAISVGFMVFSAYTATQDAVWSPYQKITVADVKIQPELGLIQEWNVARLTPEQRAAMITLPMSEGFTVRVNEDSYQHPVDFSDAAVKKYPSLAPFRFQYDRPFKILGKKTDIGEVLVLGAGTGNDVAGALRCGANHVDAVEIDSQILKLGAKHPEKPYADPRVTVHLTDARQFLANSTKKYDLIVFGLVDSHVLLSHMSNVRLDSFVFTKESFELARRCLKKEGALIVSHAVGTDWFKERMQATLAAAFGKPPQVLNENRQQAIGISYAIGETSAPGPEFPQKTVNLQDDWPFVYLERPTVPTQYLLAMGLIALVSVVSVRSIAGQTWQGLDLHFFALGAGFMLVETRGLAVLALNIGSTWGVNAAVFAGVLLMAMASNWFVARFQPSKWQGGMRAAYIILGLLLLVNFLVPLQWFLGMPPLVRVPLSILLVCAPFLASGVIFSTSLAKSGNAQSALASNLLGAMFGGLLEYFSMVLGFRLLLILAAGCYVCAAKTERK